MENRSLLLSQDPDPPGRPCSSRSLLKNRARQKPRRRLDFRSAEAHCSSSNWAAEHIRLMLCSPLPGVGGGPRPSRSCVHSACIRRAFIRYNWLGETSRLNVGDPAHPVTTAESRRDTAAQPFCQWPIWALTEHCSIFGSVPIAVHQLLRRSGAVTTSVAGTCRDTETESEEREERGRETETEVSVSRADRVFSGPSFDAIRCIAKLASSAIEPVQASAQMRNAV